MKMSSSLAGALFMLLINAQLTVTWSSIGGVALALAPAPSCKSIECPAYDIIQQGDGYEIRRYNNTLWMSTSPITDISFVNATRTGFLRLFDYIQGQNEEHAKVPMTAPVLTDILPSTGPFCESSFAVSFYVPAKFENAPPKAEESLALEQKRWDVRYAAVRRFGGFVSDYELGEEASKLQVSLSGSPWKPSLPLYSVAQYNSPFEYDGRVNEIWIFVRLHNSSFSSPSSI